MATKKRTSKPKGQDEQTETLSSPSTIGSRARIRPGKGCSIADRVAWCVHLMSMGEWNGYVTRCELAEAWGTTEKVVGNNAAEANRRLRLDPEELAQARLSHAAWLRRVRDEALSMQNNITGLPDFGAAIKATELVAKFEGHNLASQVELTGKDGKPIETSSTVSITLGAIDDALKAALANDDNANREPG